MINSALIDNIPVNEFDFVNVRVGLEKATAFKILSDTFLTIQPEGSALVVVRFSSPLQAGSINDTLIVARMDTLGDTTDVDTIFLKCTGVNPTPDLRG